MFPTAVDEVAGPTFILLPTEPLTCLAVSLTEWGGSFAPLIHLRFDLPFRLS
jgi:hypothetical protein